MMETETDSKYASTAHLVTRQKFFKQWVSEGKTWDSGEAEKIFQFNSPT